jgi:transposase
MPSRPLPTDIESLQRLVIEQRAALLSRDVEIEKLKIELARLRRMQFGRSSEKLDLTIAQLELTLEELEASESELLAPAVSMPTVEKPKPARRELTARDHYPRGTLQLPGLWRLAACHGRGCR